jgi:hypothetical protein
LLGTLGRNAAAKFGDVLLSHGADGNTLTVWPALIGAIEHIEPIVSATGDPHRTTESRARELGPANGMAILQLYRVYLNHVHLPNPVVSD